MTTTTTTQSIRKYGKTQFGGDTRIQQNGTKTN